MSAPRPHPAPAPYEDARHTSGFEPLLGAAELAERLGVPESWVRREERAGRMPHLKLGHYTRFRVSEISAWLATRARGPAPGSRPGGSSRG